MTTTSTLYKSTIDTQVADKWMYVFMAALFLTTAIIGFYPTSIALLAAVEEGTRAAIPLRVHIHAFLMVSWLSLFLLQSLLMATGQRKLHMQLGLASVILVPSIAIAAMAVTIGGWSNLSVNAPSLESSVLEMTLVRISNVLLSQIQTIVLLLIFASWAILVRRKDSETHKRMMVLAMLVTLSAAVGRMMNFRESMPETPGLYLTYTLLLIAPALVYELLRKGRIHKSYITGIAIYVLVSLPMYFLWGSELWLDTAPRLMGFR